MATSATAVLSVAIKHRKAAEAAAQTAEKSANDAKVAAEAGIALAELVEANPAVPVPSTFISKLATEAQVALLDAKAAAAKAEQAATAAKKATEVAAAVATATVSPEGQEKVTTTAATEFRLARDQAANAFSFATMAEGLTARAAHAALKAVLLRASAQTSGGAAADPSTGGSEKKVPKGNCIFIVGAEVPTLCTLLYLAQLFDWAKDSVEDGVLGVKLLCGEAAPFETEGLDWEVDATPEMCFAAGRNAASKGGEIHVSLLGHGAKTSSEEPLTTLWLGTDNVDGEEVERVLKREEFFMQIRQGLPMQGSKDPSAFPLLSMFVSSCFAGAKPEELMSDLQRQWQPLLPGRCSGYKVSIVCACCFDKTMLVSEVAPFGKMLFEDHNLHAELRDDGHGLSEETLTEHYQSAAWEMGVPHEGLQVHFSDER